MGATFYISERNVLNRNKNKRVLFFLNKKHNFNFQNEEKCKLRNVKYIIQYEANEPFLQVFTEVE